MIVSDTGPLAVLFKARLLFILKELHKEVFVPIAVERELRRKSEGNDIFKDNIWIKVTEVENIKLVKAIMLVVDEGEAEAITLALHTDACILIDEKRGRNAAKALGLEIRGTLGLFVEAKNKDIIISVKDCIDRLLEVGYYLDYELIKEVLSKVNEI